MERPDILALVLRPKSPGEGLALVKAGVKGLGPAEGLAHPHGIGVEGLLAHQEDLALGAVVFNGVFAVDGDGALIGKKAAGEDV